MTKADRIRAALADPNSPLYGSGLVPLIADYLDEAERAYDILRVLVSVKRAGVGRELVERATAAIEKAKVPA